MTAKEYLKQARYIDAGIKTKLSQAEELRELAAKATSTLSDTPRNPTGNKQKMEDTIIKIMTLENEINKDIEDLINLKKDILDSIKAIKDKECCLVLEKRYLNGERWEDIAADMCCGVDNIYKIHGKALKKFKILETLQ